MIIFENNGVLDFDALSSFGVNVKANDSAIGYFGTGLKYAMAVCMREGMSMTVWLGNEKHIVGTRTKTIRGKEFTFITFGGEQLGFTTELGKNWKPWMAFRELYCNVKDENGVVWETDKAPSGKPNKTIITVTGMDDIYRDIDQYILMASPDISTPNVKIHRTKANALYFRGIRAYELPHDLGSVLKYDIQQKMPLTEDRTLASIFLVDTLIAGAIGCHTESRDAIEKVLRAPKGTFEAGIDFTTDLRGEPSDLFMQIIEENKFNLDGINRTAIEYYRNKVGVSMQEEPSDPMTEHEEKMVNEAIRLLAEMGYDVQREKLKFFDSLGKHVHGCATLNYMVITRTAVQKGMRHLLSTLLEEHIHFSKGLVDESRELQTWLFDEIIDLQCQNKGIFI